MMLMMPTTKACTLTHRPKMMRRPSASPSNLAPIALAQGGKAQSACTRMIEALTEQDDTQKSAYQLDHKCIHEYIAQALEATTTQHTAFFDASLRACTVPDLLSIFHNSKSFLAAIGTAEAKMVPTSSDSEEASPTKRKRAMAPDPQVFRLLEGANPPA